MTRSAKKTSPGALVTAGGDSLGILPVMHTFGTVIHAFGCFGPRIWLFWELGVVSLLDL
jgi:hypothetical protein